MVTHPNSSGCSRRQALQHLGILAALGVGGWAGCTRPRHGPRISVWHLWSGRQGELFAAMLERFHQRHPTIEVEATVMRTRGMHDNLVAAAQSGSLPDVFVFDSARKQTLFDHGCLADLTPWTSADGIDLRRVLLAQDHARCRLGDRLPALPLVSAHGMAVFFANPRLLARAGWATPPRLHQWAELTEVSRQAVLRLNRPGRLDVIALDPFGGVGLLPFIVLAHGSGQPVITPDGRRSLVNSPGALRAARALDDYVETVYGAFGGWRGLLRWRHEYAGVATSPQSSPFAQGQEVFSLTGAWLVGLYREASPQLEFTVQPVPGLDRLHGGVAAHAWACGLNPRSPQPREAWALLRFITLEAEGNGRYCAAQCRPCPLAAVNDGPEYQSVRATWAGVKETIALDSTSPASVNDATLRELLVDVPLRRVAGESVDAIYADIALRHQDYIDRQRPEPMP